MESIFIKKGRVVIYRLFDTASDINLSLVEAKAKEGTKRLRLSKYPYMKSLEFADPPVSFELRGFTKKIFQRDILVSVIAKAYDFGVLSLAFYISIPEGTSFAELEQETRALDSDETIDRTSKEYVAQLNSELGEAVVNPGIKESFIEDYTIFLIEEFNRPVETSEFLKHYDPSPLLLYESKKVSPSLREETLKHRFSYHPDDLIILHLNNALIIEPSGNQDILDILEFANAQLLELRYYDDVLDRELTTIYSELPQKKGVSIFKLRAYERLAKKITRTVTDLTEVTEKVDNALKVTEDVYYARIYRTAMMIFRSRDWENSINEKLQIVNNTYRMLYNEIATKRSHLIELGIFLLIVIEIIILLVIEW
jgi:hypothetical protein